MSDTTRLKLPRIDAAQSQKHVTHNEALEVLDALLHLSVSARNVASPPSMPLEGSALIVSANPTGAFAGQGLKIAGFTDNAWRFFTPRKGWRAYVESEAQIYVFDGTDWVKLRVDLQDVQNIRYAGFGTTADAQNPLAVKLNSALFAARNVSEGGTGNLRLSLNREQSSNVVSQIYQSNWSGRAETGLIGDENFRIKVSADGGTWKEALVVDAATARVTFPNGLADPTVVAPMTGGTAANYTLSLPIRTSLPEGALFWMVPHVPNATALNIDPTLQIDQIDSAPQALKGFDGSSLYQGALEQGRLYAVRRTGGVYCVQTPRSQPNFINLFEDGGRFSGSPDTGLSTLAAYADAPYLASQNNAARVNYGLARASTNTNPTIADLFNKIRTPATQALTIDFYIQQLTLGTLTTPPVSIQSTNFYPLISSQRYTARGVTLSCYFRVMNGSAVFVNTDNMQRLLVDGMAHNFTIDSPSRLFTPAMGWKHMQAWVQPVNGAPQWLWPMRASAGGSLLLALPALVSGFETIPWDLGPMLSSRAWR